MPVTRHPRGLLVFLSVSHRLVKRGIFVRVAEDVVRKLAHDDGDVDLHQGPSFRCGSLLVVCRGVAWGAFLPAFDLKVRKSTFFNVLKNVKCRFDILSMYVKTAI